MQYWQETNEISDTIAVKKDSLDFGSCDEYESSIIDLIDPGLLKGRGGMKNFIAGFECLVDPNASIAQALGKNGFKEVIGRFTPCLEEKASPEIQCASVEEYEKAVKNLALDMYIIEKKVVINDLKQPIQQRLQLIQIQMGELAVISLSTSQFVQEQEMLGFIASKRNETDFLRYHSLKKIAIDKYQHQTEDPNTGVVKIDEFSSN